MADTHPELQAKLQELDHELEEGDITQKGCVSASAAPPPRPALRPARRLRHVQHVERSALTPRPQLREAQNRPSVAVPGPGVHGAAAA